MIFYFIFVCVEHAFLELRKNAARFRSGYCYYYLGNMCINVQTAEDFEVRVRKML